MEITHEDVVSRATEVLGTREAALDWMEKRSATLAGTPNELCRDQQSLAVMLHLNGISRHQSKSG